MKTGKKPGDNPLVTHTLKPSAELAQAVAKVLSQPKTAQGLNEAEKIVMDAIGEFNQDPRVQRLSFRPSGLAPDGLIDETQVKQAFANLAVGVKRLQTAAAGTTRVSHQEGAEVSEFDRKMMKGVIKLCAVSFSELNTPAATILTAGGKVVAVGMNRSYNPLPSFQRHGEMEALGALKQRIYTGMAQLLMLHQQRGGALSPRTQEILTKLESQGLMKDQTLGLKPDELEKQGFFAPAKIQKYERDLDAALKEGEIQRDEDGNLHPRHRQVFETAESHGTFGAQEVAGWDVLDRLHSKDPTMKLDLYTSLEPCGMCLQNCTSHGQIGRVVYGARDEAGGGISTLENYADIYFKLGRVPYELVGGVEGKAAQIMYDKFFDEVYPLVRKGEKPPEGTIEGITKNLGLD